MLAITIVELIMFKKAESGLSYTDAAITAILQIIMSSIAATIAIIVAILTTENPWVAIFIPSAIAAAVSALLNVHKEIRALRAFNHE